MTLKKDRIKAYGAFVLIERLPVERKSKGGSELPENQASKNLSCKVLSVGSGEWIGETKVHSGLKPGDIIGVRQYDGRVVGIDKNVRLVHHECIEHRVSSSTWPTEKDQDEG